MGSRNNSSRLEDIKHKEQVEMIGENRAVISVDKNSGENENTKYEIHVNYRTEDGVKSQTIESESEKELFLRFVAWFDSESSESISNIIDDSAL